MQMDYGLKLETTQKLIMTPQLRQAIAILQLSANELAALVEQELLENPVLEADAQAPEDEPEPIEQAYADQNDFTSEQIPGGDYDGWTEYLLSGMELAGTRQSATERVEQEVYTNDSVSLMDYLEMQLHFAILDPIERTIGKYLIGCIDDKGYLCGTTEEAAVNLSVPEQQVMGVLKIIQTFDPAGVGARNLKECLLPQLEQKKGLSDCEYRLATTIIEKYLDQVATGRYKCIADKLKCTIQEVQQAVDIIRTLDPKPGQAFGGGQPGYITPDVTVERINNTYVITINDNHVPQLSINPYYRQIIREADGEARKFVESRINSAVWLVKSIEQRRRTLYNVTEAIVSLQRGFFDSGAKYLRPLTMKVLAERVGVHESTVSRATANKYMATPHGLVAMSTFFSSGVHSAGGEDIAASRVKQELKELVADENPTQPLSDQALSDTLGKRGIEVSRRTVTKYREEMGIPASGKRKRY